MINEDIIEQVRRAIYDILAGQGRAPTRQQIQDLTAVDSAQVNEVIAELAMRRHVVLDHYDNVVMAHPFATMDLGLSVMGSRTLW